METSKVKRQVWATWLNATALVVVSGCATPIGGEDDADAIGELPVEETPAEPPVASTERPATGFVDVPDPNFHEEALLGMEQLPIEEPIGEEASPSGGVTPTGSGGLEIDGVCYPSCVSDSGGSQGWGWESAATCVASGSLAAGRGRPCTSGPVSVGDGFQVDGVCYPQCLDDAGDADGWGWENDESCVARDSAVAQGAGFCSGSDPGGDGAEHEWGEPGPNAGSCPTTFMCPNGTQCGCYLVPGLGARKRALRDAGAETYMLAAAMMETETMTTDYTYGDGKSGDSFNSGVCKQNWFMMRQCHGLWQGLESWHYATSDVLNDQLALDVEVFKSCRAHFGASWWAGHRNGQSGIENPNSWDIQQFRMVMDWTHQLIGTDHLLDDVRFWVHVPAI